jgi:5-formyltetrahydrofolate cyclo-ligase
MVHTDIGRAKAQARRSVSVALANLTPGRRRSAGLAVARRLARLEAVRRARTLMAFLSLPTEIDTWPIIRWAWTEGKRVAVPRVEPPLTGREKDLAGHEIVPVVLEPADVAGLADHPDVRPGALGILEVPGAPAIPAAEIDLVLAPCQAIDRAGNRLGKGGGFYDRFLARPDLRAAVIAVAFQEQVLDAVPATPNDRRVATIVTDAETIFISAAGSPPVSPGQVACGDSGGAAEPPP